MSIQDSTNRALGTIAGAAVAGKHLSQQRDIAEQEKYRGELARQEIKYNQMAGAEEIKFMQGLNKEQQAFLNNNPDVKIGLQEITSTNANMMRKEAVATDTAEAKAGK